MTGSLITGITGQDGSSGRTIIIEGYEVYGIIWRAVNI
jgi:GDP-D-mannose dehydratase